MINEQSLTLEGQFNIRLLRVESFSVPTENVILRGGHSSMICDITNSLRAYRTELMSTTAKNVASG